MNIVLHLILLVIWSVSAIFYAHNASWNAKVSRNYKLISRIATRRDEMGKVHDYRESGEIYPFLDDHNNRFREILIFSQSFQDKGESVSNSKARGVDNEFSRVKLHQFTFISSDSEPTNQINYDEGYTVTLRTSNINDRIIQASIIESTHFRREEAYIVKYIDPIEQPVIDYDSNPCKSFSFPYCVLQNYDDSDHYSFSYSIFYQSGYVIYIDIDELDIPLNYLNSTLIDSVLLSLHNNETDVFTCTTYSDRLLNGCLIDYHSLIREI